MSNEEEEELLLGRVRTSHGCINTVIHASGVLRDSWLHNLTQEAIQESFRPKAAGAWYLHKLTLEDDVWHFITFSSIAALFGNEGQANYSSSNAYLDTLARLRHSKG